MPSDCEPPILKLSSRAAPTARATHRRITSADVCRAGGGILLWIVVIAELLQYGQLMAAEHRLGLAARAGAAEVLLPRSSDASVRQCVRRDLAGCSLARRLLAVDVSVDRQAVWGRCNPGRGQEVRVHLQSSPPPTWSLLTRLGLTPDDPPLEAVYTTHAR